MAGGGNDALFWDFGNPGSYELTGGILLPTTETNFTIHPNYTQMVQREQYSGAAHEDPYEHLDKFLEICEMVHTNQVSRDYIRMHLFRHSLTGKAYRWLKNLRPNSLRTWGEVTAAFLTKFISEDKTAELRRKISTFEQAKYESLGEAWDRFKEYVRACMHHEYSKPLLIRFFYDGLNDIPKANLDSGCGGHLSKIPQAQLEDTIEEVVRNYSRSGGRRSEEKPAGKFELDQTSLKALMEQVIDKKLSKGQASSSSAQQVHSFSCDICGGTNHDTSYCGGLNPEHVAAMGYLDNQRDQRNNWRGPNPNYNPRFGDHSGPSNFNNQGASYIHPNARGNFQNKPLPQGNSMTNFQNTHFQNTNTNNPPSGPSQDTLLILDQLKNVTQQFEQKLGNIDRKVDQKFQEATSHQKILDSQVAQLAEKVSQLSNEKLPGQPTQNPATSHHHVKAISLRSGKSYEVPKEDEVEVISKDKPEEGNEQSERPIDTSGEAREEVAKGKQVEGPRHQQSSPTNQPSRFDPPIPFPERIVEKKLNEKYNKFIEMIKGLQVNIPFLEAMSQMPTYAKFLKELLSNKKKLNEERITLPHQVSALVQRQMPPKQRDPGNFTLPVKLGDLETKGALADLGASVSLMPLSIAKLLKFEMIPSRKTIQLADRSIKLPCGELEDVPIRIGNMFVP